MMMDTKTISEPMEEEMTPLDSMISRVEEYIKNPKMVTPETLSELRDELVDLKSVVDGDGEVEQEAPAEREAEKESEGGGLTVMIGKMRKGE